MRVGARTVKVELEDEPPNLAVTVAVFIVETGIGWQTKLAEILLAEKLAADGPPQAGEFELRGTEIPEKGAGELILIVPVEEAPPVTLLGLNEIDTTFGGVIVRTALAVVAPRLAVIVDVVRTETGVVLTLNEALPTPLAIVIDAGTVATMDDEFRVTVMPPVPPFELSVTVAVEVVPPAKLVGAKSILETFWAGTAAGRIKIKQTIAIRSRESLRTQFKLLPPVLLRSLVSLSLA